MDNVNPKLLTEEQKKKWLSNWEQTMITIWRDRMRKYKVWNTGALYESVSGKKPSFGGKDASQVKIIHNFLTYGIFVDMGTGKEFGGPRYKETDNTHIKGQLINTPKRKPKPWLSKAYYRSIMVARDFMIEAYGDKFKAIMFESARTIAKRLRK